jgi:transcriptional regulator with XRE-family HTH domain
MTLRQQLGKRIRYLRQQKGLSQLDFALLAMINRNYLSDVEQGRRNPSFIILVKIADALNISLEGLFKGIHAL